MTLDNEKPFILKCNVSPCLEELSTNTDLAWITVCGHIFCSKCGMRELGSLPTVCPLCSHKLNSPYDIVKSDLYPPSHFIKMVLMGLSPDDCLEAARSGILFWQAQQNLQLNTAETSTLSAQQQTTELQRQHDAKIAELGHEIAILRDECQQLKEQLARKSSANQQNYRMIPWNSKDSSMMPSSNGTSFNRRTYPAPSVPQQQPDRENRGLRKKQFMGKF